MNRITSAARIRRRVAAFLLVVAPLLVLNASACSSSPPDAATAVKSCTVDKKVILPILANPSKTSNGDVVYTSQYTAAQLYGEAISNDATGYIQLGIGDCLATFPKESSPPQGSTKCSANGNTWLVHPPAFITSGTHVHLSATVSKHFTSDGTDVACTFTDGTAAVEIHDDDL